MTSEIRKWIRAAIILLLIILSVGAIWSAKKARKNRAQPAESAEKAVTVAVHTLTTTNRAWMGELSAVLEPMHDVRVSVEQEGRVVDLAVDRGAEISRGEFLLKVDDELPQQAFMRAEASFTNAMQDVNRYTPLFKEGGVSEGQLSEITMAFALASAARNDAEIRLSQCILKSPVSGIVQDRWVELGEYVRVGDPAFRVVDISALRLVAYVPERDLGLLQARGDEVFFTVSGRRFDGRLTFVAPQSERETNTYRVELEVDNSSRALRGGMLARFHYPRRAVKDAIVVPLESLIAEKGRYYAFVEEEQRAVRRVVRIGGVQGAEAIVTSGLEAGDRLVVLGQRLLADGRALRFSGE